MKISMHSLIIPSKMTQNDYEAGSSLTLLRNIRGWECQIQTGSCLMPTCDSVQELQDCAFHCSQRKRLP